MLVIHLQRLPATPNSQKYQVKITNYRQGYIICASSWKLARGLTGSKGHNQLIMCTHIFVWIAAVSHLSCYKMLIPMGRGDLLVEPRLTRNSSVSLKLERGLALW